MKRMGAVLLMAVAAGTVMAQEEQYADSTLQAGWDMERMDVEQTRVLENVVVVEQKQKRKPFGYTVLQTGKFAVISLWQLLNAALPISVHAGNSTFLRLSEHP